MEGQSVNPPKHVRPLTKKEKAEVDRLIRKGGDARPLRRAQVVRLSAKRTKAREIADLLGFSIPTVHRIIDQFTERGTKSLFDRPRSGRPRKVTTEYVACLKEAVSNSPRKFDYAFTSWTLPRLREHLGRRSGVLLHPDYLSRLMARHDIVYRRPRHVMAHLRDQQDYDEKKALLGFLKKTRSKSGTRSISSSSTNVRFISTRP
jgi:transposase